MTQKFTINNFKQELKELAQLQHDEKLFFKHPERYPNFIKEHEEALIKEYQNFHKGDSAEKNIPWRLRENVKDNLSYQSKESQIECNNRRIRLSMLYEDYYALKHWKKLNLDEDKALFEYFYKDYIDNCNIVNRREDIQKKMNELYEKKFIDNSSEGQKIYDDLKKMYHDKLLTTSEYYDRQMQLKKISWYDYKRNNLLDRIDKEA